MGQRQSYNSTHKPQRHNETLGFNQDDHPYRMCNETGIRRDCDVTCALPVHAPTEQDFINACTLPI